MRIGRGEAWPIKAAAGRCARLLSAAAAAQAEESAVVAAAAAALFPARSAQWGPGCVSRAAAAVALRPRPESDPGECGPATLAWPRPGLGDRAPRSLGVRGSRRAGRSHSRSPLSAPACRVPYPAAPRPRAAPPGPPSPPPLAGPGQKMVQKKTAELQGFHRSFKVRAGWVWGRLGLDHSSGRWGARSPHPRDPPVAAARPLRPPPAVCLGLPQPGVRWWGWSTGHSPVPSALGTEVFPLGTPSAVRAPRPLGAPGCVSPANPCALLGSSGHSPVLSALDLWVCGVFPPGIRGRTAGPRKPS